jgi:hypothetical protein
VTALTVFCRKFQQVYILPVSPPKWRESHYDSNVAREHVDSQVEDLLPFSTRTFQLLTLPFIKAMVGHDPIFLANEDLPGKFKNHFDVPRMEDLLSLVQHKEYHHIINQCREIETDVLFSLLSTVAHPLGPSLQSESSLLRDLSPR